MREAALGARIGDYQISRALPQTAEAIVEFEATHRLLPRTARVRVLDVAHVGSELAKRLMREACILEALRHPGVPRVYECGLIEGCRPWIAVELVDGPTLADAIVERPLLVGETLALLRDLAEILHHAHSRGIVHCRLRPEHVVRGATGPCITAWANACTHDSQPHLDAADKQTYLAPELARSVRSVDARADIFSLGVIAYEALTLAPPTMPLQRRLPALPRPIALLVERMTSATTLARPSAAEVRAETMRLLDVVEPPDPIDSSVVVEEIEIELTNDVSRDREIRWTPTDAYQPPPTPPPIPTRRRSS